MTIAETFTKRAVLFLMLANLLPLFGVLFLGFDVTQILLIYWAESAVIGFFTVLKMILVPAHDTAQQVMKVFCVPFFMVHFGGFMLVHLLFILFITAFASGLAFDWSAIVSSLLWIGISVISLFIGHGVEFSQEFLQTNQRNVLTIKEIMFAPYGRIVVMHITILLGTFAYFATGQSAFLLMALILLKTFLDINTQARAGAFKPTLTAKVSIK